VINLTEGEAIKLRWFSVIEKQLRNFFFQQNIKIVNNFNAEFDTFKENINKIINEDAPRAERILKDLYTGLMRDYGTWQYKQINGDITGFNPYTLDIINSINAMAKEQTKVIQLTSKEIISKVAKTALEYGYTVEETTKLIQDKIKGIAKYRATRIARFELIGGANHASLKSADQVSGKVRKYWIYTHDKRVRPTHKHAGVKYNSKNPIDLDKKFTVGSTQLMYPADRNGDKKEILGCRCTIGYVRK
jgi:hypothetical protein